MTLSTLDPRVALIVIDLQEGIANGGRVTVHPIPAIVQRSAELARAFRQHGLPVVLVNATGRPPAPESNPPPGPHRRL